MKNYLFKGFVVFLFFSLGWMTSLVYSVHIINNDFNEQKHTAKTEDNNLYFLDERKTDSDKESPLKSLSFQAQEPVERASPKDRIKESQIHVYDNYIMIDLKDPRWAKFTDTNSMDPLFDTGSNAIQIIPPSAEDIQVGDIVSFTTKYAEGTIIHRVVKIGYDEDGWYAQTKGDNIPLPDPGKRRFKDIKRLTVAIIY